MTRQELWESMSDFYDIVTFCNDHGFDYTDNWVPEDELNDIIEERLKDDIYDYLCNRYWYQLADDLQAIDRNYEYYIDNGGFDLVGIDDFQDVLDDFLDYLENEGFFSEEDSDNDNEDAPGNGVLVDDDNQTADIMMMLSESGLVV